MNKTTMAAIAALSLLWGINWVVMKQANQFFTPVLFTLCRFALGAAVLGAILWRRGHVLPARGDRIWIFLSGVLQIAFFTAAVQIGMQHLSAGFAAILSYSMPLWVVIMAHFVLAERVNRRKCSGVAIGMAGLATLFQTQTGGPWWAVALTLAAAVAWAAANVLVKRKLPHCDILQYTTWQMAAGTVVLAIYAILFEQSSVVWNWQAAACLLYNGVGASALAFLLWTFILGNIEAAKASISMLLVPVVGVLSGVLILGEALNWQMTLGMTLILSGVWLVNGPRGQTDGV